MRTVPLLIDMIVAELRFKESNNNHVILYLKYLINIELLFNRISITDTYAVK